MSLQAFSALPIPRDYGNAMAIAAKPEDFPDVGCDWDPVGYSCIVQLEIVSEKTAGGIIKTDDQREHEQFKVCVGKVVRVGPMAFRYRDGPHAGEYWPGAPWAEVGDIVRVRLYTGDRWDQDKARGVRMAFFDDLDLRGVKRAGPAVKAFGILGD